MHTGDKDKHKRRTAPTSRTVHEYSATRGASTDVTLSLARSLKTSLERTVRLARAPREIKENCHVPSCEPRSRSLPASCGPTLAP